MTTPEAGERCEHVAVVPLRCEKRAGHPGDCSVHVQMQDDVAQLFASALDQVDAARRRYQRASWAATICAAALAVVIVVNLVRLASGG